MRFVKRLILGLFILAALAVALAYAALQMIDINKIKQMAVDEVSKQTGRTLLVEGSVSPKLGLKPSVVIEDISLSNPSWAKNPQLITAQSLTLSAHLLPLLNKRLEISDITINNATIALESSKKGSKSWEFKSPETKKDTTVTDIANTDNAVKSPDGSAVDLSINQINLNDSTLLYVDHAEGTSQTLNISSLAVNGFNGTSVESATLKGQYNHADLNLKAKLNGQLLGLDGSLSDNGATIKINGSMEIASQSFDVNVNANADQLKKLQKLVGQKGDDQTSLSVQTKVSGTQDMISFSNLQAVYGDTHVDGAGSLNLSKSKPYIKATLAVAQLEVKDKTSASAASTTSSDAPAAADASKSEPLFPIDLLRAFDADIKLTINTIKTDAMTLTDLVTSAALNNSALVLDPFGFKTKHGALNGTITINAQNAEPTMKMNIVSNDLKLTTLAKEFGDKNVVSGGNLSTHMNISSHGNDLDSLKRTANGTANFYIDQATYNLPDSAKSAASFFDVISSNGETDVVDVSCLVSNFNLSNGVATPEVMAMKTPSAIVTGSGSIDIGQSRMDMAFKARGSNVVNLSDITPPIRVQGPFDNLSFIPDPAGSIIGLGKLFLGAASGVGLVAVLGEKVTDTMGITADNNPCLQAMSEELAKKEESKPESAKETYKLLEDDFREKRDVIKQDNKEAIKNIENDVKNIRDGFLGIIKK